MSQVFHVMYMNAVCVPVGKSDLLYEGFVTVIIFSIAT